MKISENWLRQWVNPTISSSELAEQLTMLGLEVDDVAPVAIPFSGVVVGEILRVDQHPDADRLRVTTVDVGTAEPLQIVCGAPNVRVGMKAPVALVGAQLPNDMKIKNGKLRGIESQGMLCGASEIDLEDKIDGLLELPTDAPIGMDIRAYLQLDDQVIDISITPNRGDCFSIRGIAREVAVMNKMTAQAPVIVTHQPSHDQTVAIRVETAAAPRYIGRIIKNINSQATTPDWMVQALSRSGIRSHSIVVDITNYVLLELGQPMHAFDFAQISDELVVRAAKNGETLQLLNEQIVELSDDVTVIADREKVLAIGGIMGGLSSSVTDSTRDIFLESAFFQPLAIAGRARRFGLHTDASQRFERGVDFELPLLAMHRASDLIYQYAGGELGEILVHEQPQHLPQRLPIMLTQQHVDDLLGFAIPSDFIVDTLQRLECQVSGDGQGWQVTPPSHRYDLTIYQDLIEEIARIYGYDNIPIAMPTMVIHLQPYQDQSDMGQLRQTLVTLGYQEAISFSFVDDKIQQRLNPQPALALANPISSELGVMRNTLISSLIPCLQYNRNRQQERVRLFEVGLRFVGHDDDSAMSIENLQQISTIALIASGSRFDEQWAVPSQAMDFYDLKADVEQLLQLAHCQATFKPSQRPWLHPGQSAEIMVNDISIGYLGRLHPSLEPQLDLGTTWVAELDAEHILHPIRHSFRELSRFPKVRRDIAVIIRDNIHYDAIKQSIHGAAGDLLVDSWLFDIYKGQGIEAGHHSLAFALQFQHAHRTLEEGEIKAAMDRVITGLENTYSAKLRAS